MKSIQRRLYGYVVTFMTNPLRAVETLTGTRMRYSWGGCQFCCRIVSHGLELSMPLDRRIRVTDHDTSDTIDKTLWAEKILSRENCRV